MSARVQSLSKQSDDQQVNEAQVNEAQLQDEIEAAVMAAEQAQAHENEAQRPLRRRGRSRVRATPAGGKPKKVQPTTVFVLGRKRTVVKKPGDRKQYVTVNKKLIPLAKAREMEKKQA